MSAVVVSRDVSGVSVERDVVADLSRRALWVAPVVVAASAAIWGRNGALSAAYALALVVVNFWASALLLQWAARISYGLLMGVALFGFLVRMALMGGAVWLVKDAGWVELAPLCGVLLVAHLGLLAWETRHVSASLAFPGLTPTRSED